MLASRIVVIGLAHLLSVGADRQTRLSNVSDYLQGRSCVVKRRLKDSIFFLLLD